MAQVIWTQTATEELADIAGYLGSYSESYARLTVKRFYERAGQLTDFPEMGRVIPELDQSNYRELLEGNYRLMYEILSDDIILIQRVLHQARDFKS